MNTIPDECKLGFIWHILFLEGLNVNNFLYMYSKLHSHSVQTAKKYCFPSRRHNRGMFNNKHMYITKQKLMV